MDKEKAKAIILLRITVTETGCWVLGGQKHPRYGKISVDGQEFSLHKASYIVFTGEVPKGMFVCHVCDNKPCGNPNHLFLGTHSQNMKDRRNKGNSGELPKVNNPKSKRQLNKNRNAVRLNRNQQGELNGNARLKLEDVIKIKELRNAGEKLQKISEKFQIDRSTVGKIINGKRWKCPEFLEKISTT